MKTISNFKHKLLSDICLYSNQYSSNKIYCISFYGTPREVESMIESISKFGEITTEEGETLIRPYNDLRIFSQPIGYSKRHCLMYTEDKDYTGRLVVWPEGEDKEEYIFSAISQRKIPILREWIPIVESAMLDEGIFIPLRGWGLVGYEVDWDDDRICDIVHRKIFFLERRRLV